MHLVVQAEALHIFGLRILLAIGKQQLYSVAAAAVKKPSLATPSVQALLQDISKRCGSGFLRLLEELLLRHGEPPLAKCTLPRGDALGAPHEAVGHAVGGGVASTRLLFVQGERAIVDIDGLKLDLYRVA